MMIFKKSLLLILFLMSIQPVFSQTTLKNASVEDLVDRLAPQAPQKTRSLSRNLVPEANTPAEKPSVDLVIHFEFGSAKLLNQSKPLLDNLAAAMKGNALAKYTFNIEGHTDSVGTVSYNKALSEQRANAVIAYLMSKGVAKNRLLGIGKGFSEPLLGDKPDSPENRRVRIVVNT